MKAAVKEGKPATHWRRIFALTVFGALMLAALAFANSGRAAIETPPPPSVWSDKADYAPGEQVTLSGANWAAGESVHIRVNDDVGQTWSRDVDVTAAADGTISDQFNLPMSFVAVYSVTATGSSGTATWTFTDALSTTTALASSLNPSTSGQSVTFTATVTYTSTVGGHTAGDPVTVGTVVFGENGNANCGGGGFISLQAATAPDSNGQVTLTTSGLSVGSHLIRACYSGTGGSTGTQDSSASLTQTVNADTTAPTVFSINRVGVSPTNTSGNVSWTVTFSETVTGVDSTDFALANTGLGGAPAISTVTGSADTYTVTASSGTGSGTLGLNLNDNDSVQDAAGNKLGGTGTGTAGGGGTGNGSFVGQVYTIDRAAPTVTAAAVMGDAPGFVGATTYTADTWTNKDVRVTFTCADTGGSGLTAGSGNQTQDFTAETSGATATFSGTCVDNAGNAAGASSFGPIKIDKTAPDTVIDTNPSNPTNSTSANFTFHSTEAGSTFECKLDGGSFAACTSPTSYSSLSEASHTFEVRATDSAGNTDPTPASFTWTVDTTPPPVPTFGSGPSNPSNDPSPSFTFSDTEAGVTLLCRLDGTDPDPYAPCTSPKSFSGLADGSHTFLIKARDAAGNVSGANAYTWVIDTVAPPTPTIDSAPASLTNDKSPTFEFSDSEAGVSFLCDLDGAGYSACTSPKDYGDQADGEHTFSVKAEDAASNTSSAATHTWTIDATPPPAPVITDAPSGLSNDDSPTFTFTEAEAGTSLYCQLDGAGYVPCSSPQEYTGVADGEHTFHVKAVDAAGNEAATSMTWTIDATPPTLTALAVQGTAPDFDDATFYAENFWTNQDVRVDFTCTDNTGGSGVASGDPDPSSLTFDTEGVHTASSDCSDNAGNSVSTSFGVKIDKTPPVITATLTPAPNANGFNNTDVTVSYACSDSLSGLNTAYGDGVTGCPSDEHVSAEGLTTIHRGIFDNAGNGTQSDVDVRIDKTKPSSSASSPAFNNTATIHVTYTASDNAGGSGLDSVELWVKGPSDSGYTQVATDATPGASGSFDYAVPTSSGDLVDGTYRFYTIAVDKAGNREATPSTPDGATTQTVQDSVAPDTSITSHPSNPSNSSSASFSFTHSDASPSSGLKRFECNLDGAGFTTCSSPQSYSSLAEGSHTFQVRAVDNAENTDASPASFTWVVDTVAPVTTLSTNPASPDGDNDWFKQSVQVTLSATDATSGVAATKYRINGGPWTVYSAPFVVSAEGTNTVEYYSKDNAGNTESTHSQTIKIDSVKPQITGSAAPDPNGAGWNKTDVAVSFTCADVGSAASGIAMNSVAGATLTHEGRNQAVTNTGVCKDEAGNTADAQTVSGIKIDKTGPYAPSGHTNHGPEYTSGGTNWFKDDVTVSFTDNGDPMLEDLTAGSGVASVTAPETFSTQGSFSKTGKATDQAGNYSAGTTVSGNVDTAKPVVTLMCPTSVILGSSASGTWTASDPGGAAAASGIAPGVGSGSIALNTSTVGPHTAQVPANASKDNVGHFSDATSCSYDVFYNWKGFFQPIDMNVLNKAKAGSAIPVKFSLTGNQGLNIFAAGSPASAPTACNNTAYADAIEETVNAGGSSLSYDATADQYVYVWKTNTSWANSCRTLTVKLTDGTLHQANFWFVK